MPDLTTKRRSFLAWVTAGAAALIGGLVGLPIAGYTILPALKRQERRWADAGRLESLHPGKPKELDVMVTVADGWRTITTKKSVWAVKLDNGTVAVYSPLCTHLGCGYRWETGQRQFRCPCHNSYFAIDGSVLAGPAPRSLDRLPFKVDKGRLLVMYKEFKAGTREQIEL